MVWLDKKTGQTYVKKPTTSTSTPKPQPQPTTPTKPKVASVKDNMKFLKDAVTRQRAAGMAPQITPRVPDLISALMIGGSIGEAYRNYPGRVKAVSNRGEGRTTFNPPPEKRPMRTWSNAYGVGGVTPEEKAEVKAEAEAEVGSSGDKGFVDDKPSTPTRDKVAARPMNTAETKAAGKDPMHVWALHNKQMILRNQNKRQLQILEEAEGAQTTTPRADMSGRTLGTSGSYA